MRVTEAELKVLQAKGLKVVEKKHGIVVNPEHQKDKLMDALVKKPRRGKKANKTERAYALQLEALKQGGNIMHYEFESVTLKLADGTRYTPDFFVVVKDHFACYFEFHEVKGGHIWDDSKVKFKVARKMFPWFKFKMLQYKDKQWVELYPE